MKQIITAKNAAPAVGPYSHGCAVSGEIVFTSGQIALTAEGVLKNTGTIEDEAAQVMKNLEAILAAADLTFKNVVKTTIYLTNIDDFAKVNAAYGALMPEPYPARECVGVAQLPLNARVEISMIAAKAS